MSARALSMALGAIAALSLLPLLAWDVLPARFPERAHDALGAAPLVLVALGYLAMQAGRRPPASAWGRAAIVAAAFLAWAANQLWPNAAFATGWNDVAIALFVIDIALAILEKPPVDRSRLEAGLRAPDKER